MADTSFAALRARLEALPDSGHEPPNVDPRAAALAAVMVCEFVAKEGVRKRFQRVGESGEVDIAHLADLNLVARGVLQIIPKLGRQDGSVSLPPAPSDSLASGRALVIAMVVVVLGSSDEIPDARALADYVKLGDDVVETAQNLRLLASFYGEYGEILASLGSKYEEGDADKARALARSIDASVAATDSAERKEWRRWLVRAWPLLETAYDEVCRAGRFIFHRERPLFKFPLLLSVGTTSRRLKRSEAAAAKAAPVAPPQTDAIEKDWFKKAPIMVGGRPITLPKKPAAPAPRAASQRDPFKAMLTDPEGDVTARGVEKDPFAAPPSESVGASKAAAPADLAPGPVETPPGDERVSSADTPTPIPNDEDNDEAAAIEAALASVPTQEVVEIEPDADSEPITAREPSEPPPEPAKRKGPPSKLPPRKPPLPLKKPPVEDAEAAPPASPPPASEPGVDEAPSSAPAVEISVASEPAPSPTKASSAPPPPSPKPVSEPPPSAAPSPSDFEPTMDLGAELAAEFGAEDFVPPPPDSPRVAAGPPVSYREPPASVREPAPARPLPPSPSPAAPAASSARAPLGAIDRPRRTAPRFRVTLKLTMTSDDDIGMGATENLSESGAFIATPLPRASGSKLALIIAHPETGDILKLEALVRWGRPARRGVGLEAGMGVEFIDVSDEQRTLIKQMIAP